MTRNDYIEDIIDTLSADSDITSIVSSSKITIASNDKKIEYPCIILRRIGGSEVGRMGIATSSSGDRQSEERPLIRIDVVTRDSAYQAYELINYIKNLLLVDGYEVTSEFEDYDREYEAYIRTINVRLTNIYSF